MKLQPWIEKYRPQSLNEVIGITSDLREIANNNDSGHLLLTSFPGMGKTCISKLIVKKHRPNVLVLNASNERGIKVVRDKIKNFAVTASLGGGTKIINLEEFDYMTPESQNALRNLMEEVPNCRFILTANYENKIVDAIKSRCQHFKLTNPDKDEIKAHLITICEKEELSYDEEGINKLIEVQYPSIRNMVKKLQELSISNKPVISENIIDDTGDVDELIANLKAGKFLASRKIVLESLLDYEEMIRKIHDNILFDKELKPDIRLLLIEELAEFQRWINMVPNKAIELEAFLSKAIKVLGAK